MSRINATERPEAAIRPVFDDVPYRMIVFARLDGQGVPLFYVAGSASDPCGAEAALRLAHKLHKGNCYICGKPIAQANLSIDHVEPKALGGDNSIQNLAIAHKSCNNGKRHTIIEAYAPEAGRNWLEALRGQIEERLRKLPTGS